MKHAYLLLPVLLIAITAAVISCSKNNNGGKPSIQLKSINTDIQVGEGLDAKFTVKSSTAIDTFVFIRIRVNEIPLPPNSGNIDTLTGPVPDYQNQNPAEFQYQLPYSNLHEAPPTITDTFVFKYAIVDHSGHSSDTLTTPKVAVHSE